jgi:hypothetical protein
MYTFAFVVGSATARADDALVEAVCAHADHDARVAQMDQAIAASGGDSAALTRLLSGRAALGLLHAVGRDDGGACRVYLEQATSADEATRDAAFRMIGVAPPPIVEAAPALVAPGPESSISPEWVEQLVAEWLMIPHGERAEVLRQRFATATDPNQKAAFVVLGRLAQSWPPGASMEADATYAYEMLTATTPGRRSYLAAAAGFGAALSPNGLPTMTLEQARTVYAEQALSLGVVVWHACTPMPDRIRYTEFTKGYWLLGDLSAFANQRAPVATDEACNGDVIVATEFGWTVFEGSRPLMRPPEGGPRTCAASTLEVPWGRRVFTAIAKLGDYAYRDPEKPATNLAPPPPTKVAMPARAQECGRREDWQRLVDTRNAEIRSDLNISIEDVEGLQVSPSPGSQLRGCTDDTLPPGAAALCDIK